MIKYFIELLLKEEIDKRREKILEILSIIFNIFISIKLYKVVIGTSLIPQKIEYKEIINFILNGNFIVLIILYYLFDLIIYKYVFKIYLYLNKNIAKVFYYYIKKYYTIKQPIGYDPNNIKNQELLSKIKENLKETIGDKPIEIKIFDKKFKSEDRGKFKDKYLKIFEDIKENEPSINKYNYKFIILIVICNFVYFRYIFFHNIHHEIFLVVLLLFSICLILKNLILSAFFY